MDRWYMDKPYMKGHLMDYVVFQLKQGFSLDDVADVLVRYGYPKDLVDEISREAEGLGIELHGNRKATKVMDHDLYYYLQNLLIDYIKRELEQGYTLHVIKEALLKYGHHPDMVDKAIHAVESGSIDAYMPRKKLKLNPELVFFLCGLSYFSVMAYFAVVSEAEIYRIFVSLTPGLLGLLTVYLVHLRQNSYRHAYYLPLVAVLVAVVSMVIMLRVMPVLTGLGEPQVVLLINILLAFVLSSLISLFSAVRPKKIKLPEEVGGEEIQVKEGPALAADDADEDRTDKTISPHKDARHHPQGSPASGRHQGPEHLWKDYRNHNPSHPNTTLHKIPPHKTLRHETPPSETPPHKTLRHETPSHNTPHHDAHHDGAHLHQQEAHSRTALEDVVSSGGNGNKHAQVSKPQNVHPGHQLHGSQRRLRIKDL